jgi:hypothetical protein
MSDIDKKALYGRYQDQEDQRNRLAMKMAYKSLDIPEDDMQINATTTNTGVGAKTILGVAALAGVPAVVLLMVGLAPSLRDQPAQISTPPPVKAAYDAVYEQLQPDGTWKFIRREPLP